MDRTRIIERALWLAQVVAEFVARAREFFYQVVLSDRCCPRCGGSLVMNAEGVCRCRSCGSSFDPTVAYQRCSICGGRPRLRVRRYACASCGAGIVSRFLFDGLVFDAEYFRQRMVKSRQKLRELRDRVQKMLAESRSGIVDLPPADLDASPGLLQALSGLTIDTTSVAICAPRGGFDLKRYQRHIEAHIQPIPMNLDEIQPLSENAKIDRIWRFIAIIFLAHAGLLEVWQEGSAVMVKKREADAKGQGVPGDTEESDGVEGLVGRAEA